MNPSGRGRFASSLDGVLEMLTFESEWGRCRSEDEKERNRPDERVARLALLAAAAAFLMMEIVDMVVDANPERVMSTWLSLPKRKEYRLLGVYAARGSTSWLNLLLTVPPSVTGSGTGRSTVRDGAVNVVLLEEAVMPDMSDKRL